MGKSIAVAAIADEKITSRIYLIRSRKVMLDRDLAELYGVETRILNQAVRRNEQRFPHDFMFQLTMEEFKNLISQNVISRWGGVRKPPLAFTEQGVAMLSSVLSSETAIEVNIQIIRIFSRMRELLLTHKDILVKLERLEKRFLRQDARMKKSEQDIQIIFAALKQLLNPPEQPRPRVGFRRANEKD